MPPGSPERAELSPSRGCMGRHRHDDDDVRKLTAAVGKPVSTRHAKHPSAKGLVIVLHDRQPLGVIEAGRLPALEYLLTHTRVIKDIALEPPRLLELTIRKALSGPQLAREVPLGSALQRPAEIGLSSVEDAERSLTGCNSDKRADGKWRWESRKARVSPPTRHPPWLQCGSQRQPTAGSGSRSHSACGVGGASATLNPRHRGGWIGLPTAV